MYLNSPSCLFRLCRGTWPQLYDHNFISPVSRYMTTTLLIFMFMCCFDHWRVEKVVSKCWATSSSHVIRPEGVWTLLSVRSRVTLVLVMSPSPSHGPLPSPGHAGPSDQKRRFSFDLKCVSLSVSSSTRWISSTSFWTESFSFPASRASLLELSGVFCAILRDANSDLLE